MVSSDSFDVHPVLLSEAANHPFDLIGAGHPCAFSWMQITHLAEDNLLTAAEKWLSPKERLILDGYTLPRRRREWLAGRLCVKEAVIRLLKKSGIAEPCRTDISIESDKNGRPFLGFTGSTCSHYEISISHSRNQVVGMASDAWCGIDIQLLNDTLLTVRDRFCTVQELQMLKSIAADRLTRLGLLWTAKEAIRKCLSAHRLMGFRQLNLLSGEKVETGFFLDFQLQGPDLPALKSSAIRVVATMKLKYALAACVIPGNMNHA